MHIKLLQKKNYKRAEATSDLISNKIADKITKPSSTSPEKSSESVKSETGFDRQIPKGRYVPAGKKTVCFEWSRINIVIW